MLWNFWFKTRHVVEISIRILTRPKFFFVKPDTLLNFPSKIWQVVVNWIRTLTRCKLLIKNLISLRNFSTEIWYLKNFCFKIWQVLKFWFKIWLVVNKLIYKWNVVNASSRILTRCKILIRNLTEYESLILALTRCKHFYSKFDTFCNFWFKIWHAVSTLI